MGNDNPYATLWTLLGAKLFSRDDGTCPLIGFNLSNSVNNETIEITAEVRQALGFEDVVRIEHHITECYKSIVLQPYNRRDELVQLADHVANIAAKHEGGDPRRRRRTATTRPTSWTTSAIRAEMEAAGDMPRAAAQLPGQARRGQSHGAGADGAWVELRRGEEAASSGVTRRRGTRGQGERMACAGD